MPLLSRGSRGGVLAALLLTVFLSPVRADEPHLPEELTALTKQYIDAFAPITERQQARMVTLQKEYAAALAKLKDEIMQRGDLDGVVAVKDELERLEYNQELTAEQKRAMPQRLSGLRANYEQGV